MAMGLPTVAYETPVSRELLGERGTYAPPGDVAALAEALLSLLDEPPAPGAPGDGPARTGREALLLGRRRRPAGERLRELERGAFYT